MNILVTGGAGFIGSHTTDALLAAGHQVRVLDNLSPTVHRPGDPARVPKAAEFIHGDVTNAADVRRALDGVDAVYHFAAYQDYLLDFSTFFQVNAVGTALLYETIVAEKLPIRRVLVASSQAVYAEGKYGCAEHGIVFPPMRELDDLERGRWELRCPDCGRVMTPEPTDESVVNPQNQYALSKYAQEMIALNLGRRWQIPTVAFRYSIVQGPRQSFRNAYSGACRVFCLSYYLGRQPVIYEDGRQLRDFVNIEDVVRANLLLLEHPEAPGQMFNVGGGKAYSVLEFAAIVARATGSEPPRPGPAMFRFGDTRHIVSDVSRLNRLGWQPRCSPEKSVNDYLRWLREQDGVDDMVSDAMQRMRSEGVVRNVVARPSATV